MYAVLDIEATGGQMGEEDIIEIAVYRFDGRKVTDQLISLIKPDRSIDPFVQKLTQITPKMVRTAPKFHELAKRIVEITENAILVGHNVDFDYRMLKQEFKKLGYNYQRNIIDTVPLSEKYFPETNSHSLGKLCKELGIPTTDRHRASGDARATLELFKLILEKDLVKNISKTEITAKAANQTVKSGYKGLPNAAGLFYIFNPEKQIVFLSATENIAQTARKIINNRSELGRNLRPFANLIKYEITGNGLISKIKELNELKELKPVYNLSEPKTRFSIFIEKTNEFKALVIHRQTKNHKTPLVEFQDSKLAHEMLSTITKEFNLCPKLNRLTAPTNACFSYTIGECNGACLGVESIEEYNRRVQLFLDKIETKNKNFLLIGNGRTLSEKSFVWVKDDYCQGFGYFEFHNQIKDEKTIRERMTKVSKDKEFTKIIKSYLADEKYKELISLDSQ